MSKRTPIRHGEILLLPIDDLQFNSLFNPITSNAKEHTSFIVGHSETGHHHVLEADAPFQVNERRGEIYLFLHEEGRLVHKKDVDAHRTLPVAAGGYRVIKKQEFDPVQDVRRFVAD